MDYLLFYNNNNLKSGLNHSPKFTSSVELSNYSQVFNKSRKQRLRMQLGLRCNVEELNINENNCWWLFHLVFLPLFQSEPGSIERKFYTPASSSGYYLSVMGLEDASLISQSAALGGLHWQCIGLHWHLQRLGWPSVFLSSAGLFVALFLSSLLVCLSFDVHADDV